MDFTELQERILRSAYERDLARLGINFNDWAVEQGLPHDKVWRAFDELESRGLVQPTALGGNAEITGRGVLACEEMGYGDPSRVAADGMMRTKMLDKVMKAHEEYGRNSFIPVQLSQPDEPFDEQQWEFIDVRLLC